MRKRLTANIGMNKPFAWTELVGWGGVAAILTAYVLLTFGVLVPQHLTYLVLNLGGGVAIIIDSAHQKDYQPVVLNIVWATIAAIGIVRALL
mgnify:CR=1 FL=1